LRRLRDDRGDRRALRVHAPGREQRRRLHDHVAEHAIDGQRLGDVQVLRGEHGDYVRRPSGALDVDPHDSGVGVRAAHERQVQEAGRLEVVDEAPAPGQKRRVFTPPERPPNPAVRAVGGHELGGQAEEAAGGDSFDLIARRGWQVGFGERTDRVVAAHVEGVVAARTTRSAPNCSTMKRRLAALSVSESK